MGIKNKHDQLLKDVRTKAQTLLQTIRESSEFESMKYADDLLTYFYALHDDYQIRRPRSLQFSQGIPVNLEHIMYVLESKPEEAFQRNELKDFIVHLLEDITCGRIEVISKR